MNIVILVLTIFFYGMGSPPQTKAFIVDPTKSCAATAADVKAMLEARPEIQSVVVKCLDVAPGNKS